MTGTAVKEAGPGPEARDAPVEASRRKISVSAGFNLAARIVGAALGVLVAAILARTLGPDQFGSFALVLAMASMAGNISEFGFGQVAIRQMAAAPDRRPDILAAYLAARLGLSVLLAVFVGVASYVMLPSNAQSMGLLIAVSIPIGAVGAVQIGAQVRFRLDLLGTTTLIQSLMWLAAVLLLAEIDAGLTAYGIAFLAVAVAQSGIAWAVTRRVTSVSRRIDPFVLGDLARLALPLGIAGLFVTAYYKLDSVILYGFKGAEETAFFAAAYRFLDVLQIFPGVVAAVLLPYISAQRGSLTKGPALESARMALLLLGAISLPIIGGGIVLSGDIITLLYGADYHRAAPLLALLLPAFFSICAGYVFTSVLIARGHTKRLALIVAVGAIGSIGANILFVPLYGATAAAIITVLTEYAVMTSVALAAYGRSLVQVVPWARWGRIAIATTVMTGVAVWAREIGLVPALLLSAVVYAVAAVGLGAVTRGDLEVLLSRRLTVET